MRKSVFGIVVMLVGISISSCGKKQYLGVGFYNVENLFDTIDDPNTIDEQFLPQAAYAWNTEKYKSKLNHLSEVISILADGKAPSFLGVCEVENRSVLEDLIQTPKLASVPYAIVHVESKDARGIDVAALYDSVQFKLVDYGIETVDLSALDEITRDILWVRLKPKKGTDLYFIINHWPSRRDGKEASEPKRIVAAKTLLALCQKILVNDSLAQIVIMGDFNDEPDNSSLKMHLGATDQIPTSNAQLFNAMYALDKAGDGSYCYRGDWNMLDQIIVNGNLSNHTGWDLVPNSASIVNHSWLRQHTEKYEGYPLRTFGGPNYLDGYSDHFAVFVYLRFHAK